MPTETATAEAVTHSILCKNCGASMNFVPGTNTIKCEFCGTVNEIGTAKGTTVIEETDLLKFLGENSIAETEKHDVITVKCNACGASSTLMPNVVSDNCPFCGSPLVVKDGSTSSIIKPKYILPFTIDKKAAFEDFKKWIKGLWFAPNDLKKYADDADKLNGMYIPYWAYDSDTTSEYSGRRGDNYYVEETYTANENGNEVTRTRTVTRVRWTFVSGGLNENFNNVLVLASNSLPNKYTYSLEPWDITHLTNYNDDFLAGFRTEIYQVDVKQGFDTAKHIMDGAIRSSVKQQIGGDYQEIDSLQTNFNDIMFKHILLPIWLSTYRYNGKAYHFMINGRTGKVRGERPYSAIKIILTIVLACAAIAVAAIFSHNK